MTEREPATLDSVEGVPDAQVTDLGVLLRGMLMGLAEVVPGVSGGTMAFITGIYPKLVGALAAFGPISLTMLTRPSEFYTYHNLRFLLVLAAGMAVGILAFAQVMHFLLASYQVLVWAFFSGVIAMSVVVIGRVRQPARLLGWGSLGLLCGVALLLLPTLTREPQLWLIFVGGAIAVSAWLLPAVSGSYMLLALGLYAPVISAVAQQDFVILSVLAAGCGTGVLLFSKALAWLLRRHTEALLSLLTGFMLGSLPKLWPWQNAQGAEILDRLLPPQVYADTLQLPAYTLWAVVSFTCGTLVLWGITRLGERD